MPTQVQSGHLNVPRCPRRNVQLLHKRTHKLVKQMHLISKSKNQTLQSKTPVLMLFNPDPWTFPHRILCTQKNHQCPSATPGTHWLYLADKQCWKALVWPYTLDNVSLTPCPLAGSGPEDTNREVEKLLLPQGCESSSENLKLAGAWQMTICCSLHTALYIQLYFQLYIQSIYLCTDKVVNSDAESYYKSINRYSRALGCMGPQRSLAPGGVPLVTVQTVITTVFVSACPDLRSALCQLFGNVWIDGDAVQLWTIEWDW